MDDDPFPPLVVGDQVRNFKHRSLGIVEALLPDDRIQVRYDDGRVFSDMRREVLPVGKCPCGMPQQRDRPCLVGHVAALAGLETALIGDLLQCQGRKEASCIGVMLVSFIGDALGAPFEGHGGKTIRHTCGGELPTRFFPGTQMGIREVGNRFGMYTDDTNSLLALGEALCENKGVVDAELIARTYADFFYHEPRRGYPDSAKAVLTSCGKGADVRITGLSSFCFGSFANGAAMRISSLACCVPPSMPLNRFVSLIAECVCSSHVHPHAVDAAVVQAEAVRQLAAGTLERGELLKHLIGVCSTTKMRESLTFIQSFLEEEYIEGIDQIVLERCTEVGFQLFGPDAVATAVWFFLRYPKPEESLVHCVALGGDCDTTAAMLGAMLGAAFGVDWIPCRWYCMLENGPWGRDYAINLGRRLAALPTITCIDTNREFAERPLFTVIDELIPILCKHFDKKERELVDTYDPESLNNPSTKELWMSLFAVLARDGKVRHDIATCVTSFFADTYVQFSNSVNETVWQTTFENLKLLKK